MEAKKPTKPAKVTQTGPKTFYENHVDAEFTLKAEDLNMSDSYYLCEAQNCKFDFQGKIKNIFLEKCKNVKVTCKTLISGVEIVNSSRINVHCHDRVPTVQIDGSTDVHVHLSEESKGSKIVSSKSTQMNVHFPGPDKETVSDVIPSQFETTVVDGKLVTVPAELV